MKVIAPTIMHTGSHVLWYQVLRLQYQADDKDFLFGPGTGNELVMKHLNEYIPDDELEDNLVFTTLRHPSRVLASFDARCRERDLFSRQWDHMMDTVSCFVDQWLIVDDERVRDFQIARMADLTNLPLKMVSWKPDPHRGNARNGTWDFDLDDCPRAPAEYQRFYNAIVSLELARFQQE